jgi:hypothetical protein
MIEVAVKLRFIRPCLGNVRRPDCDLMLRDPDGNVMFLQTWWKKSLEFGAKACNIPIALVDDVQWSPRVDGTVEVYRRYYGDGTQYKEHEAFLAGSTIGVRAILPSRLTLIEFEEILSKAGEYVGISPYGWKANYGRFEVLEVVPRGRGSDNKVRESSSSEAGPAAVHGASSDIHASEDGVPAASEKGE